MKCIALTDRILFHYSSTCTPLGTYTFNLLFSSHKGPRGLKIMPTAYMLCVFIYVDHRTMRLIGAQPCSYCKLTYLTLPYMYLTSVYFKVLYCKADGRLYFNAHSKYTLFVLRITT